MNLDMIASGVRDILNGLGIEWIHNPNFTETPHRVARAYAEMCKGLEPIPDYTKVFPTTYTGIVSFRDIACVGLCPHHLLPIEYYIKFAYIPKEYAIGLSKIPRIIRHICQRPVLQEDLTKDIVDTFVKLLKPKGVAVIVKGMHGCMKYRGIKTESEVVTSHMTGAFLKDVKTREEFMSL